MADIGLVGLGVMGANLSLNMAEKGYSVAVYNRTTEKTDAFIANAGSLAANLVPCRTLTELAEAVRPPRPIVIMVKAGEAVDEQAEILAAHLAPGDILIDAGNANFRDTRRRVTTYAERQIDFLGVGVSGGEEGARHGPSVMAGGAARPGTGSPTSSPPSPPSSTASPVRRWSGRRARGTSSRPSTTASNMPTCR